MEYCNTTFAEAAAAAVAMAAHPTALLPAVGARCPVRSGGRCGGGPLGGACRGAFRNGCCSQPVTERASDCVSEFGRSRASRRRAAPPPDARCGTIRSKSAPRALPRHPPPHTPRLGRSEASTTSARARLSPLFPTCQRASCRVPLICTREQPQSRTEPSPTSSKESIRRLLHYSS